MKNLETWRQETLQELRKMGDTIRRRAQRIVGRPVRAVYVHGSILDAEEFTARSDVDVAVVFDVDEAPRLQDRDRYDPVVKWSLTLSDELPPVNGSMLDVCAFTRHGSPRGERIGGRIGDPLAGTPWRGVFAGGRPPKGPPPGGENTGCFPM